jgi:transcriptional regulator with XRE-family HTH domain
MENRLKELRKAKGLSQEELGKAFGVSRLAYAHWESGKFDPDLETLVKLADYFGTSIDYIYKHDTEPMFSPEEKKTLLEAAEIIERHPRQQHQNDLLTRYKRCPD